MTLLQAWLTVGVPAAALGLALFIGRSRWRPLVGYVILLVGFGVMTTVDAASGALFGVLIALIYAAGRGGSGEQQVPSLSETGVEVAESAGDRDTPYRPATVAESSPGQPRG